MNELYIFKYISKFYKDYLYKFRTDDFPNMLLYGLDKFQQYYFIKNFLKQIYNIDDKDIIERTYKINNSKSFKFRSSINHNELVINKKNFLIVHNIIDFIKDLITGNSFNNKIRYIILINVDELPKTIQWGLRSIIEKTSSTTRYILTCSGLNKIENAIISRVLQIRLPCLTNDKIYSIITDICKKEKFEITDDNIKEIIQNSPRNITRAVLILQASFVTGKYITFRDYTTIYVDKIIVYIKQFKKLKTTLKIRKILLSIIERNMDINRIFKDILNILLTFDITNEKKTNIILLVADAQHNYVRGNHAIFHLEYCIYSIINLLHNN